MNSKHEANRQHWDKAASHWRELRDADRLWTRCPEEPELAFEGGAFEEIQRALGSLKNKDVCIVGSGDNYVAFALAGCGSRVTSVDISERQLAIAAERADKLGLTIEFICSDASDLSVVEKEKFDLVTSSNGFFVWISDLRQVFKEIFRVLRQSGSYVFYDVHPFQRPWAGPDSTLSMRKPYWQTPDLDSDDSVEETFEFHWTLADLLNPLAEVGFEIESVLESSPRSARYWEDGGYEPTENERLGDWRYNALAGLPHGSPFPRGNRERGSLRYMKLEMNYTTRLRSRLESAGFRASQIEAMPEGGSSRLFKLTLKNGKVSMMGCEESLIASKGGSSASLSQSCCESRRQLLAMIRLPRASTAQCRSFVSISICSQTKARYSSTVTFDPPIFCLMDLSYWGSLTGKQRKDPLTVP